MTHLEKLNFRSVSKSTTRDPVILRRDKLVVALHEQKSVIEAVMRGEDHIKERSKWMTNSEGNRVLVKTQRRVKPWFFEQDGGWYVQCRYGARVISADGKSNAVFVKSIKDIGPVIDVMIAATKAGELDSVIAATADRKTTHNTADIKGAVRG
jgi:hypothetical protein